MTEKEIIELSSNTFLEVLRQNGLEIKIRSNSFKNTEQALYLYPKIKEAINKHKAEIEYLKKYGIDKSNPVAKIIVQGGMREDENDLIDRKIKTINQAIYLNQSYIQKINLLLETFRNDKYFDVIKLKYFERKNFQEIADIFANEKDISRDESTFRKYKNEVIHELKVLLFPNNVIDELGY